MAYVSVFAFVEHTNLPVPVWIWIGALDRRRSRVTNGQKPKLLTALFNKAAHY